MQEGKQIFKILNFNKTGRNQFAKDKEPDRKKSVNLEKNRELQGIRDNITCSWLIFAEKKRQMQEPKKKSDLVIKAEIISFWLSVLIALMAFYRKRKH